MAKQKKKARSTESTLSFDGTRALSHANDVRTSLIAALHASNVVVLECGNLEDVDLTFIQCLLSARRSATEQGKTLSLAAPAAGSLREVLQRGGFLNARDSNSSPDEAFWTTGAAS
jgi:anti-anti-sigma regulatory factor